MDKTSYRNKLVSVLRDDVFCELMNFWKKVEESQYDFKIFVSKKCYVLYKVCMPLFDFSSYEPCIKITDTAIPLYSKKMKNKTVLILDDVFIHGRTSMRINREIKPYAKELKFYVFAKNTNQGKKQDVSTKQINDIIENYLRNKEVSESIFDEQFYESFFEIGAKSRKERKKENNLIEQSKVVQGHIICKDEFQWKRISDLIMKSIWSVNMPYVSYLPTFTIDNPEKLCSLNCIELNSRRQETLHQFFSYYVRSSENENAIIHYCFIISKNTFTEDCKLTPMVFFDCENTSINKEFIRKSLRIIYGEKADKLFSIFMGDTKNQSGLISMLKYLIFNVGYLSSMRLFAEQGIRREEYDIDYTNAKFSFGTEIINYLKIMEQILDKDDVLNKIEKCEIRNLNNRKKNKIDQEMEGKLLFGLEEAYESMKKCCIEKDCLPVIDTLAKYFKYNNRYDEENVYKLQQDSFVRGLKFSTIKEFLREKKISNDDIILGLMYQYNLGAATIDFLYDYDVNDNLNGINMYWRSGEQSYKCIAHTYVLLVYFQNLYNRMFDKVIAEFLYDILMEIAEANYSLWNIPFNKKDFEKYCGLKDDIYDAFDIQEYCEDKEFKYLGYLGEQIEQFILFGHLQDACNNDKINFKKSLFEFLKKRTNGETLYYCEKIL
ncbi:hypothetical protein ABXS75_13285 [Roseburia hominis]